MPLPQHRGGGRYPRAFRNTYSNGGFDANANSNPDTYPDPNTGAGTHGHAA